MANPTVDAPVAESWTVTVVVCCGARDVGRWQVPVVAGTTVAQALGLLDHQTRKESNGASDRGLLGVWGRKVDAGQVLRPGDRIEVYRALVVDPKLARRERFKKQGVRTSGLFAKRRANAKAGY